MNIDKMINKIISPSPSIKTPNLIGAKTKMMSELARSSIFFPFTQPRVHSPMGRMIQGRMPSIQNVMKNFGLKQFSLQRDKQSKDYSFFSNKLREEDKMSSHEQIVKQIINLKSKEATVLNPKDVEIITRGVKEDFYAGKDKTLKSRWHGFIEEDNKSKNMVAVETLLSPDRTRAVEKKSFMSVRSNMIPTGNPDATSFKTMFRPSGPNIQTYEKPLHPSGTFGELFKEGKHIEIRNRRGEVVRDLTKKGDDVAINIPGLPNDTINLKASDEILYEPWFQDAGSFVFQTQNAPPGLKGKLLKIATEGDDVSPVKDEQSKNMKIAGKPVIVKSTMPVKKQTIKKVYNNIPDDTSIPLVFQTKKQYLKEYIKNQEKKKGIDFTPSEERQYIKSEMKDYKPIVARYTTKKNKYMEPKVVFFTDNSMDKRQFKATALHEYGHELWEKKGMKGTRQEEENFANNYMYKQLEKDRESRNQEEDDDVVFRGPHRKAKEGEQWVKFNTPEGKTVIFLKKIKPTVKEVENVLSSPWLSDDEKRLQLTKMGANEGQERQARMNIRLKKGSRRRRY